MTRLGNYGIMEEIIIINSHKNIRGSEHGEIMVPALYKYFTAFPLYQGFKYHKII